MLYSLLRRLRSHLLLGLLLSLCLPVQASSYERPFSEFSPWQAVSANHPDIQMRFREMEPRERSSTSYCRVQLQFRNQGKRPVDVAAQWRFYLYDLYDNDAGSRSVPFILSLPAGSYKVFRVINKSFDLGAELLPQPKSCQGNQLSRVTVIER